MEKHITTAAEARAISTKFLNVGINDIMKLVEEYAVQGKTEFEIRDKALFKKWQAELINLGYTLKMPEDNVWVLSWEKDSYTKLQEMIKRELREERRKKYILDILHDNLEDNGLLGGVSGIDKCADEIVAMMDRLIMDVTQYLHDNKITISGEMIVKEVLDKIKDGLK